jgi:deoxyribose-phosphate aldolase
MDIKQLCDEGLKYGVASVCIPPVHVSGAKRYLNGRLKICTVVGFPNGYSTTRVKTYEAADAIKSGADEVDMVINIGMVKDGCWNDVYDEIRQVRAAVPADKILKVIIETCLLTEEEKMTLCEIVSATGANYIKTSTGFSTGGATAEDVALMRRYCSPRVKIKAAGGINTFEEAQALIDLGADRIGSSRLVKLAAALEE